MTKTALRRARQNGTKRRNRDGVARPLTRMARDQAPTERRAAEAAITRTEKTRFHRAATTSRRAETLRAITAGMKSSMPD